MKGDASVWSTSHFQINERCATKSMSPFFNEMRDTRLPYEEKGDMRTRGMPRIRSLALKFQAPRSLSAHLAIFLNL
jgi:hypothetical protein